MSVARRSLLTCISVVALFVGLAACGAPEHSGVRSIDEVPFGLATVATSSTSTSTTISDQTTTTAPPNTIPTEEVRLYFIAGGQLNPVNVPLVAGASPNQVMAALLLGPPDGDAGVGLRTALDASTTAPRVGDDFTGIAAVDLPNGFFERIPTTDQRLAIGQIVLTLLDRPGFGQIIFSQQGQPISVPLASNEPAAPGRAVSRLDYVNLLQPPNSRPPVTTVPETSTSVPITPPSVEAVAASVTTSVP